MSGDFFGMNYEAGHGPLCPCGAPVAVTIRRRHTFGTGPTEWLCVQCAPAPTDCIEWVDFWQAGRDAAADRQASIERTGRFAAQGGVA